MTRLTHTESGWLRAMQISSAQVFAFVEGGLDRPFVERLIRLFAQSDTKFKVIAIKEIHDGTGGKMALLKHFRLLKKKGLLLATKWGKTFLSLFFLDKDADDVLNRKIKSSHVAYTPAYDLEGSLFACGDLSQALADACWITQEQSIALTGDVNKLLSDVSTHWSDWITLCLISQYKRKNIGCTFERISVLNTAPLQPPDASLLEQWKSNLRSTLGCTDVNFEKLYLKFYRVVIQSINVGEPLRYFNGKWLKFVLQKLLESAPKIPDANINSATERALTVLVSHVASHSQCQCCQHYEVFLRDALKLVEPQAAV